MAFFKWVLFFTLVGCQHLTNEAEPKSGLQEAYAGFVPARIAVLGCQSWPLVQLPSNDKSMLAEVCKELDAFVIKNFANQPYMHGYSPSLVKKLLQSSSQIGLIEQLPELWKKATAAAAPGDDQVSTLIKSVASSDGWRLWLHQFSVATNHADALLLPFVFSVEESCAPDRGLMTSARGIHIGLFLIDTEKGQLIWWEEKKTSLSQKQWLYETSPVCPAYPDWGLIKERVFEPLLWKAFPGRVSSY